MPKLWCRTPKAQRAAAALAGKVQEVAVNS